MNDNWSEFLCFHSHRISYVQLFLYLSFDAVYVHNVVCHCLFFTQCESFSIELLVWNWMCLDVLARKRTNKHTWISSYRCNCYVNIGWFVYIIIVFYMESIRLIYLILVQSLCAPNFFIQISFDMSREILSLEKFDWKTLAGKFVV